jgi:hypothetical protein
MITIMYVIYSEALTFVDRFTALRFTATDAPPAAKRIRISPLNQYAVGRQLSE